MSNRLKHLRKVSEQECNDFGRELLGLIYYLVVEREQLGDVSMALHQAWALEAGTLEVGGAGGEVASGEQLGAHIELGDQLVLACVEFVQLIDCELE